MHFDDALSFSTKKEKKFQCEAWMHLWPFYIGRLSPVMLPISLRSLKRTGLVWTHLNWRLLRLDAIFRNRIQVMSREPHSTWTQYSTRKMLSSRSCRSMDSFSMFLRNCAFGDSQSFHVNRKSSIVNMTGKFSKLKLVWGALVTRGHSKVVLLSSPSCYCVCQASVPLHSSWLGDLGGHIHSSELAGCMSHFSMAYSLWRFSYISCSDPAPTANQT